jgi:hypothetical protein
VRKYIDEELHLKAEIPSLRIGDSGVLSGCEVSGKGLFARSEQRLLHRLIHRWALMARPRSLLLRVDRVSVIIRWSVTGSAVQR